MLQGATTVDSGTYVYFEEGSKIENQGTLTLENEADLDNYDDNAANGLVNDSAGTVSYTGSTSPPPSKFRRLITGTVAVHEGALSFGGGTGLGADSGAFTVAAGATLDLGGTRDRGVGGDDQWGWRGRYHGYGDVHCGRESDQHRHLRS